MAAKPEESQCENKQCDDQKPNHLALIASTLTLLQFKLAIFGAQSLGALR
jgi:hypothetical protein